MTGQKYTVSARQITKFDISCNWLKATASVMV